VVHLAVSPLPCGGVLPVLLVRDLHRTRRAKPAELRGRAGRCKPLGGVAVSGLIATLWLPTSAALIGHRGLFAWPRGVVHRPSVSALAYVLLPSTCACSAGCSLRRLSATAGPPHARSAGLPVPHG
jgi:hypothetical protein